MTKPLYKLIGEHIIDDMMVAGISVLVLAFGINYFNLKSAWSQAFSAISTATNVRFIEGSLILRSISNTFPFNLLAGDFQNFFIAILVGITLTAIGFILKVMTTKTKEKFVEDLGHELAIPAVLGFLGIIALHIVTAVMLRFHASNELALAVKFNAGILVWKSFGSIFIAGLVSLVIGSVILLVAKSMKLDKIVIAGRTMVNSSYVLIGYYLFIRLLAFNVILESPVGAFLKVFIVSGDISNTIIIFTVFMFWLGRELKRYGRYLRIKKKYESREKQDINMLRPKPLTVVDTPLPSSPYARHSAYNSYYRR